MGLGKGGREVGGSGVESCANVCVCVKCRSGTVWVLDLDGGLRFLHWGGNIQRMDPRCLDIRILLRCRGRDLRHDLPPPPSLDTRPVHGA